MNYLKERVSYLKGLADGMQISDSTNEGKLLKAIIDVLEDFSLAVEDLEEMQEELNEQVDNMDEDLAEVEKVVFDDDSEDDEDDEEMCDCNFECPHCGEEIAIEDASFDDDKNSMKCPHCGKDIEIDWDCDCGCDECDDSNK